MKQFLAVFIAHSNKPKKWASLSEKEQKEKTVAGMEAWTNWVKKNEKAIVQMGSPLGKTKQADPNGLSDIKNAMTAYTVVQAESHEKAAQLFLNHPHFMIFPGDSVEIMECLPIPTM
jgi:hypothetical protein